jgi:chemotaxis signal transduction protein
MNANESQIALLTFRLAKQLYCLQIGNIVEVAAMLSLESLPDAPEAFLGVANRHGEILPMLDLRLAFKTEISPVTASSLFIVAEYRGQMLGLLVDEIQQVIYPASSALKPAGSTSRFVSHLLNYENKLYQKIDIKALLTAYLTSSQN